MDLWAWFTVDARGAASLVEGRVAPFSRHRAPLIYSDVEVAKGVTSVTAALLAARDAKRRGATLKLLPLSVQDRMAVVTY